ncbi:MAG: hypothetical protein WC584_03310 [Candidatus Pacearchaeota archaeon]
MKNKNALFDLKDRIGERLISTIYLSGLEHFETTVFDIENSYHVVFNKNYETEKMARRGHQEIVNDVSKNPDKYKIE